MAILGQKIPSKMVVALCYTLFVNTVQTALHCLNSSILLEKVRMLLERADGLLDYDY